MFLVYLAFQMDTIIMCWFIINLLVTAVIAFVYIAYYNDSIINIPEIIRKGRICYVVFLSFLILSFIPSSKTMIAMIVVPNVVQIVSTSAKSFQEGPLFEYLKTLVELETATIKKNLIDSRKTEN